MKKLLIVAVLAISGCAHTDAPPASGSTGGRVPEPTAGLDEALAQVLARREIVTAGVGLIKGGRLVWTGYYGAEEPGVSASASTRFNVASITKTVAAETVLRLVHADKLTLDASLQPYWVDPDVAEDPRHGLLTARMVLNHTTGFPNWRFFRRDRKLTFEHEPGTTYGYSGEGFEYLSRAIEKKLGEPFPQLVTEYVFRPAGITSASVRIDHDSVPNLARPEDEHGVFPGYYCRPNGWCRDDGSYSAADDMIITVPDYARFLVSVMNEEGYDSRLAQERDRIQSDKGDSRVVNCKVETAVACPKTQGYGLGFEVIDYGDFKVVGHDGSDWSELTIAYFYEPSHDGVIVFMNAPNRRALSAMPELLALVDPLSPYQPYYRTWLRSEERKEAGNGRQADR